MNEAVRKALRMRSAEEANKVLEGTSLKAEQRNESAQGYVTVYNDKVSYVISKDRNGKSNLFKHGIWSTLDSIADLKYFDFENAFEVAKEVERKYTPTKVDRYKRIKSDIDYHKSEVADMEKQIAELQARIKWAEEVIKYKEAQLCEIKS